VVTTVWCIVQCCSRLEQHPSHRTHSLRRHTLELQPTTTLDNTPHCCNYSLTLLKWAKDCSKHVELIQRSIKLLLLHLVCHLYYSPTLMMHGQTQMKLQPTLHCLELNILPNVLQIMDHILAVFSMSSSIMPPPTGLAHPDAYAHKFVFHNDSVFTLNKSIFHVPSTNDS
jgi:hypothetical protein